MVVPKPPQGGESEAVRDERAYSNGPQDLSSHHADQLWYGTGIHMPPPANGPHKRKRGHKKDGRRRKHKSDTANQDTAVLDERKAMGPGARVQFLLQEEETAEGENIFADAHPLFTEMEEFNGLEWRETARWVKFEEDVEEGGNRWSKPHVATLSLHSLFELRSCLTLGSVILDMEADELEQIVDMMLDKMVAAHQLQFHLKDDVREALLRRHTHLYEKTKTQGNVNRNESSLTVDNGGSFLSKVRSLADIGKTFSHGKNMQSQVGGTELEVPGSGVSKKVSSPAFSPSTPSPLTQPQLSLPKHGSVPRDIGRVNSTSNTADLKSNQGNRFGLSRNRTVTSFFGGDKYSEANSSKANFAPKGNVHFMKKLPPGAEASNVLIGEVEFLQQHISAFIRLKSATLLGDLTEVPVPTRFLFILLGPVGHGPQYKEIGRAIATLMSDEIFHDVAYKARNREDLLDGVDEFLDQVTVLPPGEWDPNIRIEPPSHIPSQEKRKHTTEPAKDVSLNKGGEEGGQNGDEPEKEEEAGGHGTDPSLKRTGKLFGGLIMDVKRKLPYYLSDYKDALSMQCVATVCFMFFALLAPIVTFGGLLEEATGQRMAAMENLLSAAVCGTIYHIFSGQPLTIIGSTGPVLVFETILFDLCKGLGWVYLSFRLWVNFWTALILMIMVATDASSLVSYITRFTEEGFATLIALIFIVKAITKVLHIMDDAHVIEWITNSVPANATCVCEGKRNQSSIPWFKKHAHAYNWNMSSVPWLETAANNTMYYVDYDQVPIDQCHATDGHVQGEACYHMFDVFLMSVVLMLGTFTLSMTFKGLRNSYFFPNKIRQAFSDFAVILAIALMVGLDLWMAIETPKLNVPSTFRPTWSGRGWVVSPFSGVHPKSGKPLTNPWYTALAAILPSILLCILIFMDQQITAVIVNRKENKLKKGCGYHLDLFILCILLFLVGVLGLPIYVAATVLSINHVNSLRMESESLAPGERPVMIGVREQRVTGIVTFLFVGVSVTMTSVLRYIPMPVLYGVFLYMGIASLGGIQLFDRILLIFMPMKYQPDVIYLRHVPIRRVHLFTLFQVGCLAVLWIIKAFKQTSITFPLMLVVMVGVRKLMEHVFTDKELYSLDDRMPEIHLRKRDDAKRKKEKEEQLKKALVQGDEDEDEGDEGGGGIAMKPVKTSAHLHIPMASGNVMTIPLSSIREEKEIEKPINISEEMNKSGVWKQISSESSIKGVQPSQPLPYIHTGKDASKDSHPINARKNSPPKFSTGCHDDEEEEEEPISIKIERPTPSGSAVNLKASEERQPLLSSVKVNNDNDKQESPV